MQIHQYSLGTTAIRRASTVGNRKRHLVVLSFRPMSGPPGSDDIATRYSRSAPRLRPPPTPLLLLPVSTAVGIPLCPLSVCPSVCGGRWTWAVGRWPWPWAVGHWPWPLAVAVGRGHWPWPWAVAVGRGRWPWPLAVAGGRGRSPWPLAVAVGRGRWPWPGQI